MQFLGTTKRVSAEDLPLRRSAPSWQNTGKGGLVLHRARPPLPLASREHQCPSAKGQGPMLPHHGVRTAAAALGSPSSAAPKGDSGPGTVSRGEPRRSSGLSSGRDTEAGWARRGARRGPAASRSRAASRALSSRRLDHPRRRSISARRGSCPHSGGEGSGPGPGANTHLRARFAGLGVHGRPLLPT